MNYPDYWLCKRCNRPYKIHLKIDELDYDDKEDCLQPVTKEWCFRSKEVYHTVKYTWYFKPVDNLTLVERLSQEKGV